MLRQFVRIETNMKLMFASAANIHLRNAHDPLKRRFDVPVGKIVDLRDLKRRILCSQEHVDHRFISRRVLHSNDRPVHVFRIALHFVQGVRHFLKRTRLVRPDVKFQLDVASPETCR